MTPPRHASHIIATSAGFWDLTEIREPFGLLAPEIQDALRSWPYGLDVYSSNGDWLYCGKPTFSSTNVTYRARPEPDPIYVVEVDGEVWGKFAKLEDAERSIKPGAVNPHIFRRVETLVC